MKNKDQKKIVQTIIICLLLILFYSCRGQNKITIKAESIKILNVVLIEDPTICLNEETFKNHQTINPSYIINHLERVNNSNENSSAYQLFYTDVKKSFSKDEIKALKTNITTWTIEKWKKADFLNNSKCLNNRILKISEPVFNKDFNKALVFVASQINNSGSYYVKVLIKENDIWIINGGFPIGISN